MAATTTIAEITQNGTTCGRDFCTATPVGTDSGTSSVVGCIVVEFNSTA